MHGDQYIESSVYVYNIVIDLFVRVRSIFMLLFLMCVDSANYIANVRDNGSAVYNLEGQFSVKCL